MSGQTVPLSKKLEKETLDFKYSIFLIFTFSSFIGIIVIIAYASNFGVGELSADPLDWGIFGDYVGGTLTAAFSFSALIALLLGLSLQRSELREARKAIEHSAEGVKIQRFENTLFNMLGLLNNIIETIHLPDRNGAPIVGRRAFERLFTLHLVPLVALSSESGSFKVKIFQSHYSDRFDDDFSLVFGHYFRTLYWIYKLIDEELSIDEASKKKYSGLVRSQLS